MLKVVVGDDEEIVQSNMGHSLLVETSSRSERKTVLPVRLERSDAEVDRIISYA